MRFSTVSTTSLGIGVLAALALAAPSGTWPTEVQTESVDHTVSQVDPTGDLP